MKKLQAALFAYLLLLVLGSILGTIALLIYLAVWIFQHGPWYVGALYVIGLSLPACGVALVVLTAREQRRRDAERDARTETWLRIRREVRS